ncbi:MAG TPA: ATP-binding protein [Burkholderiales bacterium]
MDDGNDKRVPTGESNDSLLRSEQKFRLLVEGVKDYAIFLLDPQGYVSSWNAGAERIKGYSEHEIVGQHFSRFYPSEAIDRHWPEHELRVARATGRFEDEGLRVRKDGSMFWANVVLTALYDEEGKLYGFAKVTRDLTERKQLEDLERSGRRANEFLAMLAHELRNPLAPICNAVSVMRAQEPGDSVMRWSIGVIDRQAQQLSRLVDDLLDVSRITQGKIALNVEPLILGDIAVRAIETSRPLIDARGQQLELAVPPEPIRVQGDMTRLSQVVLNLLNNAAKYTPEGGRIRLSLEQANDEAVICVQDDGIGIRPEMLEAIFDLFVQGGRTLARSEGGLGIGLTLVKQLVSMHGGKVAAFSDGPGKGARFVVRLPLLAAIPASVDARHEAGAVMPRGDAHRVLVVDDNFDSAQSMTMLLQLWGYNVRCTYDGAQALAIAAEFNPEAVLLDIGLPGMSGYEVAGHLRKLPGLDRVMLIAMTGYGQSEDRHRTSEAGFQRHLLKPVKAELLQGVLGELAPAPQGGE